MQKNVMHIVKMNQEKFNQMADDWYRQLPTTKDFDESEAIRWATSIEDKAENILWRYDRPNGILWIVRVKGR